MRVTIRLYYYIIYDCSYYFFFFPSTCISYLVKGDREKVSSFADFSRVEPFNLFF